MHKGIMGARRLEALDSIISSVQDMGDQEAAEKAAALQQIRHRDPEIRTLFVLEGMAELMEHVAQIAHGPGRQELVNTLKAEVPDLTKTSTEALEAWAAEDG